MVGFRTSTKEIIEHIYSGNIIKESVTLGNFQCKAMLKEEWRNKNKPETYRKQTVKWQL